ncbi:hypothetical protein CYLTODRAFT_493339 [Cylindrobasidium torrendii FP15055 ss-10]|uniref:Mediator of RNA polymerase II transcription subunit 19 n=1 Tax=Cylindrobasidium torrendii FP15055 ss-10 TaxID=1314674 RepID=A0A0D7B1X4_9AGAR|nr:hypothetical protein CYLTODRAFT_493339 [Cylindrobasidium torrendii FP15055 ss-10]
MNNAVAGPSRPHTPPAEIVSDPVPLFFPPPVRAVPPIFFRSTEDLISKFHLFDAYDKYVKNEEQDDAEPSSPTADKGKGKAKEKDSLAVPPHTPAPAAGDPDDDEGGAKDKIKKSYKHLIKGVPGKHSMKKDDYLATMMAMPPKQRINIQPFDERTQEDFSVSLEGLKGWNITTLILESAQAREDRKRRKELKRLAKAQASLPQTPLPQASTPASPMTASTPRPTGPVSRPTSAKPHVPPVQVNGLSTPRPGVSTPRTTTPHPLSAPPVSASTLQAKQQQQAVRGIKRPREDTVGTPSANPPTPQQAPQQVPKAIVGARAGNAGVRPRPIKKQRVDMQGQARDSTLPMQQPTPQGV